MTASETILYDYHYSSAAYRLRLALALLDMDYTPVPVDLRAGAHLEPEHRARNPQGFVPALWIDGRMLTQSVAILEYLDETRSVGWLPRDAVGRQRVRTLAHVIAMDIHPVCNLSVARAGSGDGDIGPWMHRFIPRGLEAFEALLDDPATGRFCHGDRVGLADLCLLPQLFNADRWGVPVAHLERIGRVRAALEEIPALAAAHPEQVKPPEA